MGLTYNDPGIFIQEKYPLKLQEVKDSDTITLGKSNNEIVCPARVGLSHNTPMPRTLTSITKLTRSISASSGQYGLHTSDSSAVNSSSKNSNNSLLLSSDYASDHEFDVMKVNPPPKLSLSTIVPSANITLLPAQVIQQTPPQQVQFAPDPAVIPIPPHSINTEQGWKGLHPGNLRGGNKVVEMQNMERSRTLNNP
ncbi:hypothetical protein DFH05DRAFT_1519888 [Lentinula detonsa]|uniref:Uncharacterized protein n=1 Tax=Lentinula detonsa TaxID=2804962 RepID=A0A9W8P7E8_9AGAR|nr:hypothetical protein DFH05DRAFT_1519888 [Lentinula detonsa]